MQSTDTQQFFEIWDQCAEMYGKEVSPGAKQMAFKLLAGYPLADIKLALRQHMSDPDGGQFYPKVADVIRKIRQHSQNQFPGAEQAWAMFPRDEALSACICDEMAVAWGVACEQDEISGRMAFKETYNREVARSQALNKSPKWFITCGHDKQHREQVALDAVRDKLISPAAAQTHLPHIAREDLQLLANNEITTNKLLENHAQTVNSMDQLLLEAPENLTSPESAKSHLAEIMKTLNGSVEEEAVS